MNRFLFLEGIDVARDVEVVVVLLDLAQLGDMAEFLDALPLPVGADDALDVLGAEVVVLSNFLKPLAGVDEEDVVGVLPLLLQHQNAGGDAGAVEDIGRQADDGVEPVAVLNQVAADVSLGGAAEEHAVRQDAGHGRA